MSKFMVSKVNGATTQFHTVLNGAMSGKDVVTGLLGFALACLAVTVFGGMSV